MKQHFPLFFNAPLPELYSFPSAGTRCVKAWPFTHLRPPSAVVVAVVVLPRCTVLSGGGILHQGTPVIQEEDSLLAQPSAGVKGGEAEALEHTSGS